MGRGSAKLEELSGGQARHDAKRGTVWMLVVVDSGQGEGQNPIILLSYQNGAKPQLVWGLGNFSTLPLLLFQS